ncbi:matB [Escherichia coli]|nr:matB [Escherichia coli]
MTNTLTQLDTSGSTLNVGVDYNGAAVENWRYRDDRYRQRRTGGNLSPLANGYNASNRTTAQDGFTFHHQRHHQWYHRSNRLQHSTEGIWSGDVSVQFDATRPVNLSDVPAGSPCFIPRTELL